MNSINDHEGKKYLRAISPADAKGETINVDIYEVLVAFGVTCPAIAHCIKKLLACGTRGKGDTLADLLGADAALSRAIELQRARDAKNCDEPAECPHCDKGRVSYPDMDGTTTHTCRYCHGAYRLGAKDARSEKQGEHLGR